MCENCATIVQNDEKVIPLKKYFKLFLQTAPYLWPVRYRVVQAALGSLWADWLKSFVILSSQNQQFCIDVLLDW